jgi:hypothetical protein
MTWEEFTMARQLEVELEIGVLVREAKREEDRAAAKARKSVTSGARR